MGTFDGVETTIEAAPTGGLTTLTTFARHLLIPGLMSLAVLGACGDDSADSSDTRQTAADTSPTTADAATVGGQTATTVVGGSTTNAPTVGTTAPSVPASTTAAAAGPTVIEVTVGVNSGPDRVETVPAGAEVQLVITNPAADDEFHLHDYDLGDGQEVPAGTPASFSFTADKLGMFELESHATDDVLLTLSVE
jgi:hypothetical protein